MSDNTPEMQALVDALASDQSQTLHAMAEHHVLVFRWLLEGYEVKDKTSFVKNLNALMLEALKK